ncbi:MAG: M1 family metallopeptidase [Flavobacteriales bacterium]|nr:M1 family metallopeptidase [Flavobacteriales bacterium]
MEAKRHVLVRLLILEIAVNCFGPVQGQCDRWQQRVQYKMEVELNDRTHQYSAEALLFYMNNSPDTLREVFFHLFFNAFRPGSEMDVRSRSIVDPDSRIGDRIAGLQPHEMGEIHLLEITQENKPVEQIEMGTIAKVILQKALLPGKSTVLRYKFKGQVPIQIRRAGHDNAEGIAYSMGQWYPKLAEYDQRGWHADPYVSREFFGVWGDFDVTLTLDSAYTVASTGVLQDPELIGKGYASIQPGNKAKGSTISWRFVAKDVHDFAWTADKDYVHTTEQVPDGPLLHFFRKNDPETAEVWSQLPEYMVKCFTYMNDTFGKYPWPQFTIAQGGDGGMEYPMITLLTGKRRLGSLVGTSVHEALHSWYYGVLANNESRYPWMDEGFAEYAGSKVMNELFPAQEDPHAPAYASYFALVKNPDHEAPVIHGDHFLTNRVYSNTAYSFGEVFVRQLGAVVGEKKLASGLLRYYNTCGMKHPEPIDFERVMEKESGLELDWYFDEWLNTTRTADYGIRSVLQIGNELHIGLERIDEQLMPVDLAITWRDGNTEYYHIPLSLMLRARPTGSDSVSYTDLPAWQWTDKYYELVLPGTITELSRVMLDPFQRVADIDRTNDVLEIVEGANGYLKP